MKTLPSATRCGATGIARAFLFLATAVLTTVFSAEARGTAPELHPLTDTREITDLTPCIADMQFMSLEEKEGHLLSYLKKVLLDNDGNLIIQDVRGEIAKYSEDGKYLFPIGHIGRGAGEYVSVSDICLSSDGRQVLVCHLGGVAVYSCEDGKFLRNIDLPPMNFEGICPGNGNRFYLLSVAPTNDPEDFKVEYNTLYLFSEQGKEPIAAQLPRKDYILNVAPFTQSCDGGYFLRPLEGEKMLYKIRSEKVVPCRRISYDDKMAPAMSIFRNGELDFGNYISSPYFKMTLYVHDTKACLYFAAMGPRGNTHNFVYDGSLKHGIRWENAMRDPTPALVLASDREYLYVMLADVESYLDKQAAEMNPLTRVIVRKIKEQAQPCNGNPMIVKIRFKGL